MDNTTPNEVKMSKAETEMHAEVDVVYAKATASDKEKAQEIATIPRMDSVTITPVVAAVLARDYNKRNRDMTVSKVRDYQGAINRGEWKLNHQGLAFYPDGIIADGQHRVHAMALSDTPVETTVFPNFDKAAIDTIDRSKGRTAGEALVMLGVENGKDKASVGKTVMEYEFMLIHGSRPRFTDPQVEKWVMEHNEALDDAFNIADGSFKNVTDACLAKAEARTIATLMLRGGWGKQMTVSFIASIQQGVATYPESPTVILSKLYLRSKINARKADRLTKMQKLALALKGAALWADEKSVARLNWKATKEELPTNLRGGLEEAYAA